MAVNPVTGGFAVPDGAPRETSQPLSAELRAQHDAISKRNEKVLPPFAPAKQSKGVVARTVQAAADFFGADPVVQTPPEAHPAVAYVHRADDPPEPPAELTVTPALEPAESWQPAASNSDSPSRGLPTRESDPGKAISGGFGAVGEAAYYPLDGAELGAILLAKLDELKKRIPNDLRFSMATCYPRVRAFVEIHVEGFADVQHDFSVKTVPLEKNALPIEVARAHSDEVMFVLLAAHVEMTDAGESITPPNAARLAAGLSVPMKQRIDSPSGGVVVDLVK